MTNFSTDEFRQGFLEEANQHLLSITNHLLRLEVIEGRQPGSSLRLQAGDELAVERVELLSELARSFHTLKGLSGMVGLEQAAALSHAMESVLQAIQRGQLVITVEGMDTLLQGTRALAGIVETVRKPDLLMPDVAPYIEKIQGLLLPKNAPAPSPAPVVEIAEIAHHGLRALIPGLASYPAIEKALGELEESKVIAAAKAGQSFSLITFSSSAERAARGENVDMVRQQISEIGTLIKAVPVMGGGVFQFHFLVASSQPVDPASVNADDVIPLVVQGTSPEVTPGAVLRQAASSRGMQMETAGSPVVRVNLDRLDELMRVAGDLLMQRSRLGDALENLEGVPEAQRRDLNLIFQKMGRSLRDLRRGILRARMVPLAESFGRMPLVVRDLARASQKDVRLEIAGENIEVDKLLVERLLDPLLHLVRNAISHGIETPEERSAAGKPEQGRLLLRGSLHGDHILVEVTDDGRGLDLERIAAKAVDLGWRKADQPLDITEALEIITSPGFSTRGEADIAAGRGVGLDIVQRMVRSNGGRLSMESTPGKGTTFRLRLPLTLVIMDVLFVNAGTERFAAPRSAIERVIEIDPAQIVRTESNTLLHKQEGYYILHNLADLFHAGEANGTMALKFGLQAWMDEEDRHENASGLPVLVVDRVSDVREVVVHTLADPLVAQPGIDGATELADGSVVLILDIPALLRLAKKG